MKRGRCLATTALVGLLAGSCSSNPTTTPTTLPAVVEYTISGSASSPDVGIDVDDELRLYLNGQPIGTVTYGSYVTARFEARPGDSLVIEAVDTCQGQYRLGELWLHRAGLVARQITPGVASCSLSEIACLPVDCSAPDRTFFQQRFTLP
jgi:hypothetical protein